MCVVADEFINRQEQDSDLEVCTNYCSVLTQRSVSCRSAIRDLELNYLASLSLLESVIILSTKARGS